jgi:hypothetical protein
MRVNIVTSRLLKPVKAFRLQYPVKQNFGPRSTWIFITIAIVGSVILMLLTVAGQAYEPITVYSRSFNGSTTLWYERLLRGATSRLGLPKSWDCSSSIIQLGDSSTPYLF